MLLAFLQILFLQRYALRLTPFIDRKPLDCYYASRASSLEELRWGQQHEIKTASYMFE